MSTRHYKFQGNVIEGITIDFWNSIADDNNYELRTQKRAEITHKWLISHDYHVKTEEIAALFDSFTTDWYQQWRKTQFTLGPLDCVAQILKGLKIKLRPSLVEELATIIEEVVLDFPPKLIDGVVDAIARLHDDLLLGIICDTAISGPHSINALLKDWGISRFIDVRAYSLDVGVSKPNSVIYRNALDQMVVDPNRAIHFGDLEETDVKGAKDFGMFAVRFDGCKGDRERKKRTRADMIVESWEEFMSALTVSDHV
ncbi:MAG: HAD family hydrolase [Candidatus Electryonea clarkiae]|nr:HAD family hydrolase [Candidatus Electryonea clarkiae]MDP8286839.1 HAD family hydrolase [Candidatus Electryonea clarkiae]